MELNEYVAIGKIAGVYGVKGWVRVIPFTEHKQDVLNYDPWYLGSEHLGSEHSGSEADPKAIALVQGKVHGKGVVALLGDIMDRDQAYRLNGLNIYVKRSQLPDLPIGEYYWRDLEGLEVSDTDGRKLGNVSHLLETGANDVLVVKSDDTQAPEILIPFIRDKVVKSVDLNENKLIVEWDPDY